jgi:hypothetical protein
MIFIPYNELLLSRHMAGLGVGVKSEGLAVHGD